MQTDISHNSKKGFVYHSERAEPDAFKMKAWETYIKMQRTDELFLNFGCRRFCYHNSECDQDFPMKGKVNERQFFVTDLEMQFCTYQHSQDACQ